MTHRHLRSDLLPGAFSRRSMLRGTALAAGTLTLGGLAGCGGGSGFVEPGETQSQAAGPAQLKLLYAGDATGTTAVKDAAAAWESSTGSTVTVTAATDMNQELSQGFAAGNPPDVFTVDSSVFAGYAKAGNLTAYGDQLPMAGDFNDSLKQAFTFDGTFYAAPKDTSALALIINTQLWEKAGLSESDIPTDWDQLAEVARKLTSGNVKGLVIGDTRDRIGAFMRQAGGWFTNPEQTEMTADSPENLQALQYVQKLLSDGVAAFPKQVGAGWGGEAFGKQVAAMTIEGNWVKGALKSDFSDVEYQVAELPAGPAGKGTLAFTQCWGIAARSQFQEQARAFVEALMAPDVQLMMATTLGVMPSVTSAQQTYAEQTPEDAGFVAGLEYAQGPVTAIGMDAVLKDLDTKLQGLPGADPKAILASVQTNGAAALQKQ